MKLFERHDTERTLDRLPELPPDVEVPDDISGLRHPTTLRPSGRQVRWIRWVAAIVVLVAAGGVTAMLLSSSDTDVVPAVDYMERYGTDNPVILDEDAVAGTVQIVGTVDYMDVYGTDNPVFVEGAAEAEDTGEWMERYGTDNPVFVPEASFMERYGTDNPVFVEGN